MPSLRHLLLLLALLPAVLLPRGLRMDWCDCASQEASCCAVLEEAPTCCSASETDQAETQPHQECGDCCLALEIDWQGDLLVASELSPLDQPLLLLGSAVLAHSTCVDREVHGDLSLRGPPRPALPMALRRGCAPLRL